MELDPIQDVYMEADTIRRVLVAGCIVCLDRHYTSAYQKLP